MDRAEYYYVKFCGLTRLEDAITAVRMGVDMLGFNFYPKSPRYLAPEECAQLIEKLRLELGEILRSVRLVGVFVNPMPEQVEDTLKLCNLDLAQISGDETLKDFTKLTGRAYKAVRSDGYQTLVEIGVPYFRRGTPPALLVDASSPGLFGGSGRLADWREAAELSLLAPILLAGGLTPSNVVQAIQAVRPWGVDVASGIETTPGVKDKSKMLDFLQAVRDHQAIQ
jgi:phosphoribosylanthranilate isomerase